MPTSPGRLRTAVLAVALTFVGAVTATGARAHVPADPHPARRTAIAGVTGGVTGGVRVQQFQYAGTDDPYQSLTATWDPSLTGAPWVITVHGGSWAHGSEADVQPVVDVLRAHGYQVFNLSYRLVADYPGAPAVRWTDQRSDVLTALGWVRAHAAEFGLDPGRGAMYGSSAGGQLAAVAGLSGDGDNGIRAIVSASGVLDPKRLWQDVRGGRPDEPATPDMANLAGWTVAATGCPYGVDVPGCAERWEQFDPASYLSPHDPAVAMYQGTSDRTVPYRMARSFRDTLDDHDIGGYLTLVPDLGHTFRATFDGGVDQAAVLRFLRERTAVDRPPTLSGITASPAPAVLPDRPGLDVRLSGADTGTVAASVAGRTVLALVRQGHARVLLPRLAPGRWTVGVRYLGTPAVQPSHTTVTVDVPDRSGVLAGARRVTP